MCVPGLKTTVREISTLGQMINMIVQILNVIYKSNQNETTFPFDYMNVRQH